MPTLEPIGRVDDLDDLDLEPVIIPVVGYTADKEEVVFDATFRPVQPTGAVVDMMRQIDSNGNVQPPVIIEYLDSCLAEGHHDDWSEFIHSPDVFVEFSTLTAVYEAIVEYYTARPTPQRSVSHNGRVTSKTTSRAAARSKGSTGSGSKRGKG